jgi:methanogenic corrinoid protein MtbC1
MSIRQHVSPAPSIMAGGRPFLVSPELYHKVGADATAGDCELAVRAANRIMGIGSPV